MDQNSKNPVIFNLYEFEEFQMHLSSILENSGFNCSGFKIKHYNDTVQSIFKLPYHPDTVAFVVINTPKMFEKTFLPFIKSQTLGGLRDPLDQCMQNYFKNIKKKFPRYNMEIIHDFDLLPNRRPKALLQTAAHISGVAYYYQRSDIKGAPWKPSQKIFGVCVHPEYGGWFAIRTILILKNVTCSNLPKHDPVDCVNEEEQRIILLEKFNFNWQDLTFRDIIPVKERYSPLQIKYFTTEPKDRFNLLQEIIHTGC